jgi:hypothetical protein
MKTLNFPSERKDWVVGESDISEDDEESESSEEVSSKTKRPLEEEKPKPVAKQATKGKYVRQMFPSLCSLL